MFGNPRQARRDLYTLAWDASKLGDAIEALAHASRLTPRRLHAPSAPDNLVLNNDDDLEPWISLVAKYLDIEAERVDSSYGEIGSFVHGAAPAILELNQLQPTVSENGEPTLDAPRRSFLVLLRGGSKVVVLAPDLTRHVIDSQLIRDALCLPLEAPYLEAVDEILARAHVPEERRPRVRRLFLAEQLSTARAARGWMLRQSPATSYVNQLRAAKVLPLAAVVLFTIVLQQVLSLLTWGIIGGSALQGHFDWVWLGSWALLLLTAIPLQLLMSGAGARLGAHIGGVFRNVLLYGSLKLEPEEIRHEGIGHFLDRIMDADVVQYGGITSALTMLLAASQIIAAFGVLAVGAGGWLSAGLLALFVLILLALGWEYWRTNQWGAGSYREMTNNLVERLIGHRTRLAQQDPARWHANEDQELSTYLESSESEARLGNWIGSLPQAWLIVGLATGISAFVIRGLSATELAISLGGVLLAQQALAAIALQVASFVPLALAWRQVRPLFLAARRETDKAAPTFLAAHPTQRAQDAALVSLPANPRAETASFTPLITLRNISFRYRERARLALDNISLQIKSGERILVEGPSGGGKSTLAAVLAGLRLPESGLLLLRGYDRLSVGSEGWRERVVVAPQFHENHVFAETFAFNLLMGRRWPPTPEDEQEAVEICGELGLGEVLARMPSGLRQIVGESGWQLSHGEQSRLFIARALLQRAELIILDESFAALDPENLARALQCVLRRAPTLMVIAHP